MIDFALSNNRDIVTDCGVITKADKGSDHRLVRIKIKINKNKSKIYEEIQNTNHRYTKTYGI